MDEGKLLELKDASTLGDPAVRELMDQAVKLNPVSGNGAPGMIIKSVSAKQRPRRPAPALIRLTDPCFLVL